MSHLYVFITAAVILPFASSEKVVRVVVDETAIFHDGVPLDFSYNETSEDGRVVSSPGCPESLNGIPWVYYGKPPRCYVIGFQGPCPSGTLKLIGQSDSLTGLCDCSCFDTYPGHSSPKEKYCIDKEQKVAFTFVAEYNRCYPLWQQGYCKNPEEWLILDSEHSPLCETRRCPPVDSYGQIIHPKSNKSSEVLQPSELSLSFYSETARGCHWIDESCGQQKKHHRYQFVEEYWIPQCSDLPHE